MQETCERILEYETSRHGMKGRVKPFIKLHDIAAAINLPLIK